MALQKLDYYSKAPTPAPSLTQQATRGFKWMVVQTAGIKAISMASQLVLAWLLTPDHFGLIGLAYTVTAFTSIVQQAGVREVLVRRHRRFELWSNPAFWMSLSLSVVAAVATLVAAPIGSWIYKNDALHGLLIVMAISMPLGALLTVPGARLQSDMRFRALAALGWMEGVLTSGLTVLFAALGFGAYSFVLPRPIVFVLLAVMYWWLAPAPVKLRMEYRRWKFLYADVAALFLTSVAMTVIMQGDYMMLGIFRGMGDVGIYFLAYNLSTQTIQLIGLNLINVLFPALNKLGHDLVRQTQAFLRALGVLADVGIPLCMLQAALAEPVLRLLLEAKWIAAIPVLVVLSIAMSPNLVAGSALSLFKAQGRFNALFVLHTIGAALFLAATCIGALIGRSLSVAVAVLVFNFIFYPIMIFLAIRPGGGKVRDIVNALLLPTITGGVAALLGYSVGRLVPAGTLQHPAQVVIISLVTGFSYLALMWLLARERLVRIFALIFPR